MERLREQRPFFFIPGRFSQPVSAAGSIQGPPRHIRLQLHAHAKRHAVGEEAARNRHFGMEKALVWAGYSFLGCSFRASWNTCDRRDLGRFCDRRDWVRTPRALLDLAFTVCSFLVWTDDEGHRWALCAPCSLACSRAPLLMRVASFLYRWIYPHSLFCYGDGKTCVGRGHLVQKEENGRMSGWRIALEPTPGDL